MNAKTATATRILVQRVLSDMLEDERLGQPLELVDFLHEDAELNAGFIGTFDVRIGAPISDPIDDFESMIVGDMSGRTTEDALVSIAAARYGCDGRAAVIDLLTSLANRREQTVAERGVW